MIKPTPFLIMLILVGMLFSALTVIFQANVDSNMAETAVDQMQIEGSQTYTVYHNLSETIYTISAICIFAIVIYTIYSIIQRGNKK